MSDNKEELELGLNLVIPITLGKRKKEEDDLKVCKKRAPYKENIGPDEPDLYLMKRNILNLRVEYVRKIRVVVSDYGELCKLTDQEFKKGSIVIKPGAACRPKNKINYEVGDGFDNRYKTTKFGGAALGKVFEKFSEQHIRPKKEYTDRVESYIYYCLKAFVSEVANKFEWEHDLYQKYCPNEHQEWCSNERGEVYMLLFYPDPRYFESF